MIMAKNKKFNNPRFLLVSSVFLIVSLLFVSTNNVAHALTIANFPAGFTFTKDLKYGMTDNDVLRLQQVLNANQATQVAASGVGSIGSETTYFGSLTKSAVIKFQNYYYNDILAPNGLTSGTGYVGPSTRSKLNSLISGVVSTGGSSGSQATGQPTLDFRANGVSNVISVPVGTAVNFTWSSVNASYCSPDAAGTMSKPANGSVSYQVNQSGVVTMYCFNSTGASVSSMINVIATNAAGGTVTSATNGTGANYSSGTVNTATTGTLPPLSSYGSATSTTSGTTTKKYVVATTTLEGGTIVNVIPCAFSPGNFLLYVDPTYATTTPQKKTATSTTATSTASSTAQKAATTTIKVAPQYDSLVWVMGDSKAQDAPMPFAVPAPGMMLDMVVLKTPSSCSPIGSYPKVLGAYMHSPF